MSRYYSGQQSEAAYQWNKLLTEPPSLLACDVETVSLSDRRVLGIGVAVSPQHIFYITADDPAFLLMLSLLRDVRITKVWHNAPFDLRVLRKYSPDIYNIADTAIMCRILGKRATLEESTLDFGIEGVYGARRLQPEGKIDFSKLSEYDVAMKCIRDCFGTYLLYQHMEYLTQQEYYQTEIQLIPKLEEVSRRGIPIDQEKRQELQNYYQSQRDFLYTIADGYGFNPGSPQQVGYVLAARGNILPFTKTWQLSTDEKVLRKLKDPLAGLVLDYRHHQKMLGTYLKPLEGVERAYTTLHLDAITGRVSGTSAGDSEPDRNLCNIPKKVERGKVASVRSMFHMPGGVWDKKDESQAELRILAYLSKDQTMQAVFESGESIHKDTQARTGLDYDTSKIVNYAICYGADASTLSDQTGRPVAECYQWIQQWKAARPQANAWMEEIQREGLRQGYVETLFGRKMPLPLEQGEKHARNCAIDYPIQGTAADIFKRTWLAMGEEAIDQTYLLIHDEWAFDGVQRLDPGIADVTPVHIPIEEYSGSTWDCEHG